MNFLIAVEAVLFTPFVGGMTLLGIFAVAAVRKKEREIREAVEARLDEPRICGVHGPDGMRCTLRPHNTLETKCQDETRSTVYSSATFWAWEVGAA